MLSTARAEFGWNVLSPRCFVELSAIMGPALVYLRFFCSAPYTSPRCSESTPTTHQDPRFKQLWCVHPWKNVMWSTCWKSHCALLCTKCVDSCSCESAFSTETETLFPVIVRHTIHRCCRSHGEVADGDWNCVLTVCEVFQWWHTRFAMWDRAASAIQVNATCNSAGAFDTECFQRVAESTFRKLLKLWPCSFVHRMCGLTQAAESAFSKLLKIFSDSLKLKKFFLCCETHCCADAAGTAFPSWPHNEEFPHLWTNCQLCQKCQVLLSVFRRTAPHQGSILSSILVRLATVATCCCSSCWCECNWWWWLWNCLVHDQNGFCQLPCCLHVQGRKQLPKILHL